MRAFLIALTILTFLVCGATVNDVYLSEVCESVIKKTESGLYVEALEIFKRNELMLKNSVDNGYVIEARVSLESIISATEHNDDYEADRYIKDAKLRVERVKKALFI